jgi:hypothetical protein
MAVAPGRYGANENKAMKKLIIQTTAKRMTTSHFLMRLTDRELREAARDIGAPIGKLKHQTALALDGKLCKLEAPIKIVIG